MKTGRLGIFPLLAFLVFFCGFQSLLVYWFALDPGFIPDLAQAEHLIQQREFAPALHHLKPLAENGSARAECLLGELYVNGDGVGRNVREGIRHLERAADGGVLQAQFLLSRLYSYGEGVPKDLVRAHFWLSLAAVQEHQDAPGLLLMLERMMTREQIEQAWAMAEKRMPGARQRSQFQ